MRIFSQILGFLCQYHWFLSGRLYLFGAMIVFNFLYLFTMPPCWQTLWILNALIHVLPINSLYKLKKKKRIHALHIYLKMEFIWCLMVVLLFKPMVVTVSFMTVLICKVEFYQPSCWLYSIPNLLVFQQFVTLYLGGILVRVVSEIVWRNAEECARKIETRNWISRVTHSCKPLEVAHVPGMPKVEASRQLEHYRTK